MVAIADPTIPKVPTKHRFTVDQYYKMGEVGILGLEQRTELIEGEIIEMSPIGTKHAACLSKLADALHDRARNLALVRQQNPIRLSDQSEPQPDIAVVKERQDYYLESHPIPTEIFLLIEVADSTLKYDRNVKVPLYAKAGIPELWIANLEAQVFEVYRQPNETGYQQVQIYGKGAIINLLMLPDVAIAVDDIF
jgi:Uma2 family endonuclease